jgi:hypothetical protein
VVEICRAALFDVNGGGSGPRVLPYHYAVWTSHAITHLFIKSNSFTGGLLARLTQRNDDCDIIMIGIVVNRGGSRGHKYIVGHDWYVGTP